MRDDQKLREARLVFYKEDMDKIEKLVDEFIRLSNTKCVLLVDKDGHPVAVHGQTGSYDMDTISALIAGSFAATREMARLLGEEEFSVLFHQGRRDSIHLTLVGERTLLAAIFDEKTTIGMVRLYATEVSKKLGALFDAITKRAPNKEQQISKDFGKAAEGKLDDFFGKS
jgi:predicted regulator of Ras-like GTPase activity (Roadblock/LC7/MglB family)